MLIIYYSYSGNTRRMAEIIHEIVDCDILEIKPVTPYSTDFDTTALEARYQFISGNRPTLKSLDIDFSRYDMIFIGSPRWWTTLAIPVITFLTQYNLSGKTVIPFSTHGGDPKDRIFDDIRLLCPSSNILEGLALEGEKVTIATDVITGWLQRIELIKK